MTEAVIALIPTYGLGLVFVVIVLACLAVPLPASMITLAAGAFVAAGDLVWWQVLSCACAAFIIGDQIVFWVASTAGGRFLVWLERKPRLAKPLNKSREMINSKGQAAVLLSHTILSPTCPYVSYLCGAGGLSWVRFTTAAIPGALIWTCAYVGLGFVFATQLTQVASILSQFFGLVLALVGVSVGALWVHRAWRTNTAKVA